MSIAPVSPGKRGGSRGKGFPPWLRCACTSLAALCLVGCQTYSRSPLDFPRHAEALHARVEDESLATFAQRLRAQGAEVPRHFDVTDGLSAEEGEVVALFFNPDLRLARLEAGVARATRDTAGLWQDPELGFDAAQILSPTSFFDWGLDLELTIPISGRLQVEKDKASAAYEVTRRRIVAAEWATRAHVRMAWSSWSLAEERARLLRGVVREVEELADLAAELERTGDLSRVEGRLFRVELADRKAALTAASLEAAVARIELLGLMGLPADAPVRLMEGGQPRASEPLVDTGDGRLLEENADLAVRVAEYDVAEEHLRLQVREQFPDLTIGSGYGSESRDSRLLFGVSVPLPVLNANRGGIAEAHAARELARAVVETTYEELLRELHATRAKLAAARAQIRAFEAEVVPMLSEQAREVVELARLGDVNTLLLLDTVTRQFEAKARLLDMRRVEVDAAHRIFELLGPPRSHGGVSSAVRAESGGAR